MTDISQAIIDSANTTAFPGPGMCLKWTDDVYTNAGINIVRRPTATEAARANVISTDKSAIPIGACVYGTGRNSGGAGHVGIYIGSGNVMDSKDSSTAVESLESWLSWQTDVIDGQQGWRGWGWGDGDQVRGTTNDPNVKQSKDNKDKDDKNKEDDKDKKSENTNVQAGTRAVSGDGYNEEYTSSSGITYKHYKQYQGTYAIQPYWSGDMTSSGCGPTSVAILASGLTDYDYDPGVIGEEMNSAYGYTGAEPIKNEMNSLGMESEIIFSPSAETIQNNLREGKVMIVSVTGDTIFTDVGHVMTAVDINESGQVYILNPGARDQCGWYDISEIMKGCNYIVVTDSGKKGIARTSNSSEYVAIVSNWRKIETVVINEEGKKEIKESYIMTTSTVDYESMTKQYTMPFDLLWAFLVIGEDKSFIFEWTDLIYDSEIEITVYDNYTTNIDITEQQYTKQTKAVVNSKITAECDGIKATETVKDDIHDPVKEEELQLQKQLQHKLIV